jgi:WD40 repeat protein
VPYGRRQTGRLSYDKEAVVLHLRGHKSKVNCLAFSPDGRLLATGGHDHSIRLWQACTGRPAGTLSGHEGYVYGVAFSPDGMLLASSSYDGSVRVWDVAGLRQKARWRHEEVSIWQGLAFAPDGRTVAVASETPFCGAVIWDLAGREVRRSRNLRPHPGLCLAFSPDGKTLCYGDNHGALLWDPKADTERRLDLADTVRSVAYAPDGQTLAVATSHLIELWDLAPGQRRATLQPDSGLVWSVAWTPDGQGLLSAGKGGTVGVWEVATGRLREAFDWGLGKLNAVAVAPDGMTAAVCGAGRDVVVWDLV